MWSTCWSLHKFGSAFFMYSINNLHLLFSRQIFLTLFFLFIVILETFSKVLPNSILISWCVPLIFLSDHLLLVIALCHHLGMPPLPLCVVLLGLGSSCHASPDSPACVRKVATHKNPLSWMSGHLVLPYMLHTYSRRKRFCFVSYRCCCIRVIQVYSHRQFQWHKPENSSFELSFVTCHCKSLCKYNHVFNNIAFWVIIWLRTISPTEL